MIHALGGLGVQRGRTPRRLAAVFVCVLASFASADVIDVTQGWRFAPDAGGTGGAQGWSGPSFDDTRWATLEGGKRWEEQGFAQVDGAAWYRLRVDVPASWSGKPVWFAVGGINDAGAIYCNGERINTYGDHETRSVATVPIIAHLTDEISFGEPNCIAVEVFDWGASGGLWSLPCILTNDPAQLPAQQVLACYVEMDARKLLVDVDVTGLGDDRPDQEVNVEVRTPGGETLELMQVLGPEDTAADTFEFALPDPRPGGTYRVQASVAGPYGGLLAHLTARSEVVWPSPPRWPEQYGELTILNNFVTELKTIPRIRKADTECSFTNPREGWVFLAVTGGAPGATLDGGRELVWRRHPETGAHEAMLPLTAGKHRLHLTRAKGASLTVRAVPEIAFCYYPSGRHIAAYPPYDWAFVERHVLSDVNTLITGGNVPPEQFAQWRSEGRQWIANASLPGLSDAQPPDAGTVYDTWARNPGVTDLGYAGLIVDEFLWAGAGHYDAWTEALVRLHASPAFDGRTFYAWCTDIHQHAPSLQFAKQIMQLGYRFSWERYLPETVSPKEARSQFLREVTARFAQWKSAVPGVERRMVVCLGYLSAPPETLNLNPGVDYHVFMDMQFQALATDPTFWGLYGVMEYMANYADEESLRYAQRLFRHYCIEGRRERFSSDPYVLPHLHNPDFADGLRGWAVEASEPNAVAAGSMEGFSWLQGRYPKTSDGDRFCAMRRSPNGPNRVSQTIKALQPGRLYSLKFISGAPEQLERAQQVAVSGEIANADLLPEYAFQFTYPSSYSHDHGPYSREHRAHMNFHRLVFRPRTTSATLTISDWATRTEPGGPAGQTIAINFVEVQPFHAPNETSTAPPAAR